jgi:putative transposase
MSRPPSPWGTERNPGLRPRSHALQAEHPYWGDRRLGASRRFVAPRPGHQPRRLRLLRAHQRLVTPPPCSVKRSGHPQGVNPSPASRTHSGASRGPRGWGKAWGGDLVVGRDWPMTSVGPSAGMRCPSPPWLAALEMAVTRQGPEGAQGQGLAVRRAHGGQPASPTDMQTCGTWAIQPALTRDHTPQGHADTERMRRTRKEEGLWRQAWTGPFT